jgi:hypothetical protein
LRVNPPPRLLLLFEESDARSKSQPVRAPFDLSESDEAPLLFLRRELLREGVWASVTFSVTGADMDVGPVAVIVQVLSVGGRL